MYLKKLLCSYPEIAYIEAIKSAKHLLTIDSSTFDVLYVYTIHGLRIVEVVRVI